MWILKRKKFLNCSKPFLVVGVGVPLFSCAFNRCLSNENMDMMLFKKNILDLFIKINIIYLLDYLLYVP